MQPGWAGGVGTGIGGTPYGPTMSGLGLGQQVVPQGPIGGFLGGIAPGIGGTLGGLFGSPGLGQQIGQGLAPILSLLPFGLNPWMGAYGGGQQMVPQTQAGIGGLLGGIAPWSSGLTGGLGGVPGFGQQFGQPPLPIPGLSPFGASPALGAYGLGQQQAVPQSVLTSWPGLPAAGVSPWAGAGLQYRGGL